MLEGVGNWDAVEVIVGKAFPIADFQFTADVPLERVGCKAFATAEASWAEATFQTTLEIRIFWAGASLTCYGFQDVVTLPEWKKPTGRQDFSMMGLTSAA